MVPNVMSTERDLTLVQIILAKEVSNIHVR